MRKPVFRNPDVLPLLGFREYIRNNFPSGPDGLVAEDIDLIIRWYGPNFGLDNNGQFILCELKNGLHEKVGLAQQMTFGLIHRLLKHADPNGRYYKGFYVINYTDEDWERASFKVNGQDMTLKELNRFLLKKYFDG